MSAEAINQPRTHFIEWDQPKLLGRQQRAVCGRLVRCESFSITPTCEDCQRAMHEDDETAVALAQEFPELKGRL